MKSHSTRIPSLAQKKARSLGPIALLLFMSGIVALVYEVVWQRQFALVFGSGAPATAAVLAAYFAGLGIGARVMGKRAIKSPRPLRTYAILELGIGAGALLVPVFLSAFEQAYPSVFQALSGHPTLFMAVRTSLAFAALLIPTFCMGGTLPLLGDFVDGGRKHVGLTAGALYVLNTIGAGLGALAFPFLLLPRLGVMGTVELCALINGVLALAAWRLDSRCPEVLLKPEVNAAAQKPAARVKSVPDDAVMPVSLLSFISGAATFALQVLWNRAFAQVHENSIYSFAVIVAVVIFPLAIGGQLARVGLKSGVKPRRLLGAAWTVGGLTVLAGPYLFLKLSHGLSYLPAGAGWFGHAGELTALAAAVLVMPITLLGVGLPTIMEDAGRVAGDSASEVLGRLFAANVIGSVFGALTAGFVLPHWLGLWSSVLWIGILIVTAGLWQWIGWPSARARRNSGILLATTWAASLLVVRHVELPRVWLATVQGEQLVALTEGTHGITAVVERPRSRRLKLNNHYGLGGTASTGDERMQSHIPLLLHLSPRRVAFLGLGTGITAGGAMFHPVDQVTVMELVPEVVAASRLHFGTANAHVLDDPRTRIVQDDARNFLRGSREQFDLIVGDLVVPWRQGEGSLFTLSNSPPQKAGF